MIKLYDKEPGEGGAINEALLEAVGKVASLEAEVVRLKKENELLQVDYANKLAIAKVEFETKELDYKKSIRDLRVSLELRNSNERQKEKGKAMSPNQLWDEALNITKK